MKGQLKNFAVLSGVAVQMGVMIFLFVKLGKWLDSKYNQDGKAFLVLCTLVGVAASLYVVLKQLKKINEE